jgi:hydrogenase-4 component F
MLLILLLLLPLATAGLPLLSKRYLPQVAVAGVVSSGGQFLIALLLAWKCLEQKSVAWGPGEFFRVDALSAVLLLVVTGVAWISNWFGVGYLHLARSEKSLDDASLRRYYLLVPLFIFSMMLSVTANNVGLMWVAVEATTITTAFLVGLQQSKSALEASWKYILLGSVGIALAFVGTVLGYFNFVQRVGQTEFALHWTVLSQVAGRLNGDVLKLAFVFLLIGYGTKAGLAPMHTWLPDAHAEAPSPISAMMSGSLLVVALHAIMRWKVVVDRCIGPEFTNQILQLVGALSVVMAALMLIRQGNYKRMLAYSSVEHLGLTCLGLGLGPLGILAALLHTLAHAAGKSMVFLLSGNLLHCYRSTRIASVHGLLRIMPVTGSFYGLGIMALLGLPPFGMFPSKLLLLQAGIATHHPWLIGLILSLIVIIFTFMSGYLIQMLSGPPPAEVHVPVSEAASAMPLALNLGLLVLLGLYIPEPLLRLLWLAVEIVQ